MMHIKKLPGPIFNAYYLKNRHFYDDILTTCSSFDELLLQTDLAGIKWGVHDWSIILISLLSNVCINRLDKDDSVQTLFNDLLYHINIDTYPEITNIFTNNIILKQLIICHSQLKANSYASLKNIYCFFAHLFNRWPQIAKMPYMFTTYKKQKYHIILRCYIKSSKTSDNKIINYISHDYKSLKTTNITFDTYLSEFINSNLMIFPGQEK